MTKSDGGLWPLVKKNMPKVHWQRIETPMTGGGVPDLNGCYGGVEAWIELKHVSAGFKIRSLSTFQCSWFLKRFNAKGQVFLLVRVTKNNEDKIWLYDGNDIEAVKENGLRIKPRLSFDSCDKNGWDMAQYFMFEKYKEDLLEAWLNEKDQHEVLEAWVKAGNLG